MSKKLLLFLAIAISSNISCFISSATSLSGRKIEQIGNTMTRNSNQMGTSATTVILALGTASILFIAGKEQNKTIAAIGFAGIAPLLYSIQNDNDINTKLLENNRRLSEDLLKVKEEESNIQ